MAPSRFLLAMLKTVCVLFLVGGAHGHGAMITPAPRNAIDSTIPGANWGNGTNHTGTLEPLKVHCVNGTEPNACHPGQSVFWFSQGCTPGCAECDG